jgi:hypothetical protein
MLRTHVITYWQISGKDLRGSMSFLLRILNRIASYVHILGNIATERYPDHVHTLSNRHTNRDWLNVLDNPRSHSVCLPWA